MADHYNVQVMMQRVTNTHQSIGIPDPKSYARKEQIIGTTRNVTEVVRLNLSSEDCSESEKARLIRATIHHLALLGNLRCELHDLNGNSDG